MISLLAQASHTPPPGFSDWIASAFYLVGLVAAVVVLYQRLRPRPTQPVAVMDKPLKVQGTARYVEEEAFKTEITNVHGRIGRERKEVDAQLAEIKSAHIRQAETGEAHSVRLHARIDDLDRRVDHIPQRVIELLATTKQYHTAPPVPSRQTPRLTKTATTCAGSSSPACAPTTGAARPSSSSPTPAPPASGPRSPSW
jgi:hypothetical protein